MDFIFLTSKSNKCYGTVYARIRTHGISKKHTLKYKIKKSEWDKYRNHKYEDHMEIPSIGIRYTDFAKILEEVRTYFETSYNSSDAVSKIQAIKTKVLHGSEESAQAEDDGSYYLDDAILAYSNDLLTGKRLRYCRGVRVSIHYVNHFIQLHNIIKRFQQEKCCRLRLEDVDMDFRNDFVEWLYKCKYSRNSIRKILREIFLVVLASFEDKLTKNDIRRFYSWSLSASTSREVYFTMEQIETLYNTVFSKDKIIEFITANIKDESEREKELKFITSTTAKTMRKCVDIYLVGLFTGQRPSDYFRINSKMLTKINDEWFIHLTQKKTNKTIYIPLDKRVKEILDRNGGSLPVYSTGTVNIYMKKVCSYLGWNYDTGIEKIRKGKQLSRRFCDRIATRTPRYSFASNAYLAGISMDSIMAVTGHTSEKILDSYIQVKNEDRFLHVADDLDGFMEL